MAEALRKQDTFASMLGATTGYDTPSSGDVPGAEPQEVPFPPKASTEPSPAPKSSLRKQPSRGASFVKHVSIVAGAVGDSLNLNRQDTLGSILGATTGRFSAGASQIADDDLASIPPEEASQAGSFSLRDTIHSLAAAQAPPEPLGIGFSERGALVVPAAAVSRALGPLEARGLRLIGAKVSRDEADAAPVATLVFEGVGAVRACMRAGLGLGSGCLRLCGTQAEVLELVAARFAPTELLSDADLAPRLHAAHPRRAIAQSERLLDYEMLEAAEPGSPVSAAFCQALRVEGYVHVTAPPDTFEALRRVEELASLWFNQGQQAKEEDCDPAAYGHVDGKFTGYHCGRYREQLEVRVDKRGGVLPEPSSVKDLPAALATALATLEGHGRALLKHIAYDLGVEAGWLHALLDAGDAAAEARAPKQADAQPQLRHALMRLCRYKADVPGVGGSNVQCDDHTDVGFITLDPHASCPGLQVLRRADRAWVNAESDAEPISCAVIAVMVGDTLERVSGGYYEATRHRVLAPDEGERIGMPYLLRGRLDATIDTTSPREAAKKAGRTVHLSTMETTTIKELPALDAAQSIFKNWFKSTQVTDDERNKRT